MRNKYLLVLVFVASIVLSFTESGHPTLSDNLGLFDESTRFHFKIRDYVFGTVWPKPQVENKGSKLFSVDSKTFRFTTSGEPSNIVSNAIERYKVLTFPDANVPYDPSYSQLLSVDVHVSEKEKPMELGMDESYSITVSSPNAQIKATTVWGALKALETFSQLVYQNKSRNYFVAENSISDHPRFSHRGFLIDTSRHYLSVKIIHQFIDALVYSKYNVLHWHIVDSESFPYVSTTFPSLHQKGAFDPVSHIYTPDDVQNIIEYARLRGVRVIPEFDTPGHTQSWGSIKDLLTPCYSYGKFNGNYGPVNPTVESNYDFLEKLFAEVAHAFPDDYLHLGGDEVSFHCWQTNPNITAWMKQKGMAGNYSQLEQYYEQRLLDIIGSLQKKYVIWQEVVDNNVKVKDDTVVNVWKGGWQNEMAKVTKLGYRSILSTPWYLNYVSYPGYGPGWPNYYRVNPQGFNGTKEQLDLVIGGTACMWGEWVDGTNVISRSWANGLAVGERLWSAENVTDISDATKRIWEHRCRYVRRGIPAENVVESQYCRHEWMD